jgi:glycerate kinase
MPQVLTTVKKIDVSGLDKRVMHTEVIILCDVENYLLGGEGAAKTFGPQKGATVEEVDLMETALTRWNEMVYQETGQDMSLIKHGGAAGGVAASLQIFINAKLVKGIDYFLDLLNFKEHLQNADLVITGEGSIDDQTIKGKAPLGVAKLAKQLLIPVIGIAGKVPLMEDEHLREYFDVLLPVNHGVMDLENAVKDTYNNLVRTGIALGNLLALMNIKKGETLK